MSGGGQVVDLFFFFLNDPPPPDLSSLPPHAPLPISPRQCRLRKEALLFESSRQRSRVSGIRSEEHTSELQSQSNLVCRLLLEKKNYIIDQPLLYLENTILILPGFLLS